MSLMSACCLLSGCYPSVINSMRYFGTRAGFYTGRSWILQKVDRSLPVNSIRTLTTTLPRCQGESKQYYVKSCHLSRRHTPTRWLSTTLPTMEKLKPDQIKKRVEDLTDRFAEARELLGDARESLGSTYFSDDMIEAQEAVTATIAAYKSLLKDLEEDQRNDVIRTIGLRMEELKAQEQAIKDLLE